jgi:hypothetical protein
MLRDQGFCYPHSAAYAGERLHRKLSDIGRGAYDPLNVTEAFGIECAEALTAGVNTIILSSEFLHSRLRYAADIARVGAFLRPFFDEIQIVYYARRQDLLLTSMHSTGVRGGFAGPALAVYERKGHYYFDHLQICDLWAGEFGSSNLTCRIYERSKMIKGDIIDDFGAIVGLTRGAEQPWPTANQSLSFETMSALLFFNNSDQRGDRVLWRKLIAKGKKRGGPHIPMLTKTDAREFLSRFRDGNREFFARYVDKTLATEFYEDFSGFPDTIPVMATEEIEAFVHE